MITLEGKLKEPFDPTQISWRVGSTNKDKTKGLPLAYIDARNVMDRLDSVVGTFGWKDAYVETSKGRVLCTIFIWDEDKGWVGKSDGAGETQYEGEKGAISDAFKRAAVKWGIGRYLYDIKAPWVSVEQKGRSVVIQTDELPKLINLLPGPAITDEQYKQIISLANEIYSEEQHEDLAKWISNDRVKTFTELNIYEAERLVNKLSNKMKES